MHLVNGFVMSPVGLIHTEYWYFGKASAAWIVAARDAKAKNFIYLSFKLIINNK